MRPNPRCPSSCLRTNDWKHMAGATHLIKGSSVEPSRNASLLRPPMTVAQLLCVAFGDRFLNLRGGNGRGLARGAHDRFGVNAKEKCGAGQRDRGQERG